MDQKTQEPLEGDAHRATDVAQRETFQQQAFNECTLVLRDEVLFKTVDKLPSAVVAVMLLFATVKWYLSALLSETLVVTFKTGPLSFEGLAEPGGQRKWKAH